MRFNIVRVGTNAYIHIYDDLVAALRGSLEDLDYPCTIATNLYAGDMVNILVGASIFAATLPAFQRLAGRPYMVFQLEQLSDQHGLLPQHPAYRTLLCGAAVVLDYSPAGTAYLRRLGVPAFHLPPGFHRSMERFRPSAQPDIDVLFYGSPHPRRKAVIDDLLARGIRAVAIARVFGHELAALIRRAKIVLNVHADAALDVLETVRLSYLLANRCLVISETADHDPYEDGVIYARYDELAATCERWLAEPHERRARVADAGYLAIRRIDMMADLGCILAQLDLPALVAPPC